MTARQTIFMFSGQGSQYFQMGRALFDSHKTFHDSMLRLDEIVRTAAGRSAIGALYDNGRGKADIFDRTLLTHPAIFMVEYSLAQCLMQAGIVPDMVLGVSLGSFAAAAVAGLIGVEDALTAVIQQALALEEFGEPGGMIAVLADPALFTEDFLGSRAELAAVNFSSHFVLSARGTELASIQADLKKRNIGYQQLPVSLPFHSQWIDKARVPFEKFMYSISFKPGRVPLACCEQTTFLFNVSAGFFWDVVRRPIRFRDMVLRLEHQGSYRYIDLGPAGTLATFLKYQGISTANGSTVQAILTPFGSDNRNLTAALAPA